MSISEKLKEARKNASLTQDDVERKTSINKKTISNWENGVSRPDVDSLSVLCKLYGVNPNTIFEWENDPSPSRDEIRTIAAHHDKEEWSDEELDEVERFKEWVRAKRKQK